MSRKTPAEAEVKEKTEMNSTGGEVVSMSERAPAPDPSSTAPEPLTVEIIENPDGSKAFNWPPGVLEKVQKEEPMVQFLGRLMMGQARHEELFSVLAGMGIHVVPSRVPRRPVVVGEDGQPPQQQEVAPTETAPGNGAVTPPDLVRLTEEQHYILSAFYNESVGPLLNLVGQRIAQRHAEMLGDGYDMTITVSSDGFRVCVVVPAMVEEDPNDEDTILSRVIADYDQLGEACAEAVLRAADKEEEILSGQSE